MKNFLLWSAGFAFLFLFNLFVEFLVLPTLNLDNTPKNDLYFQVWWLCVGVWLVFGNMILSSLAKRKSNENGEQRSDISAETLAISD